MFSWGNGRLNSIQYNFMWVMHFLHRTVMKTLYCVTEQQKPGLNLQARMSLKKLIRGEKIPQTVVSKNCPTCPYARMVHPPVWAVDCKTLWLRGWTRDVLIEHVAVPYVTLGIRCNRAARGPVGLVLSCASTTPGLPLFLELGWRTGDGAWWLGVIASNLKSKLPSTMSLLLDLMSNKSYWS